MYNTTVEKNVKKNIYICMYNTTVEKNMEKNVSMCITECIYVYCWTAVINTF